MVASGISQAALFAALVIYVSGVAAGVVHEASARGDVGSTIAAWIVCLMVGHTFVASVGIAITVTTAPDKSRAHVSER